MPTGSKPETSALTREAAAVLRGWMARRGLTQAMMSEATDISQSQLSKLLRGERTMDLDQMFSICAALGLNPVSVLAEAEASMPVQAPHATTVTARDIAAGASLPPAAPRRRKTPTSGTTATARTSEDTI